MDVCEGNQEIAHTTYRLERLIEGLLLIGKALTTPIQLIEYNKQLFLPHNLPLVQEKHTYLLTPEHKTRKRH